MKRSKKALSRGRSERRTTRPILVIGPASAGCRGELLPGAGTVTRAQLLLHAAPLFLGRTETRPDAVGIEFPSIGVLGKTALQHIEQLSPQSLVFDRRHQLDPTVEVARH